MNIKNKLLVAALVTGTMLGTTANAAYQEYNTVSPGKRLFSGPYITAGTGLSQQHYKSTGNGDNSVIKSDIGLGISDITPFGLFMAGEVQLGMNNQLRDKVGKGFFNNLGTSQGYQTKITETTNSLATLVKLGTPIFVNTVVYGMAGPEVSGFKVKTKSNGNSRTKNSMNVGLVLGAGVDTYITPNFTVGLSYANTVHNKVKSNNLREFFADLGAGNVQIDHKRPKVESNAVIFNIAYRF